MEKLSRPLKTTSLKSLILNTLEPIVLKDVLTWRILDWDKQKWEQILQNEELEFRLGKNAHTNIPQWETLTNITKGKFSDIFKYSSTTSKEWIYFDYKYLKHHLLHIKELRENISWQQVGLDEVVAEDCALWIGSKGAHTSLHVDTYGCNVIAQVYGRKLWVLFPPDADLKKTRIPYEESSIFSQYNLFSPDVDSMKEIKNCKKVVLNPGEILVVPWKWWHYVENLEPAISINAWIPLPQDDEERLREAIVQMLMSQMTSNLCDENKKQIINPNMISNMMSSSQTQTEEFLLVDCCKKICLSNKCETETSISTTTNCIENLYKELEHNIKDIATLNENEYREFLQSQALRFCTHQHREENSNELKVICNIINAVTDSNVISLISNKLLQK